jgi:hypothetical protein
MPITIDPLQLMNIVASIITAGGIIQALTKYLEGTKDPFLKYYILSSAFAVATSWLGLWYLSGREQLWGVIVVFGFVSFFATVAVLWRRLDVERYLKTPNEYPRPVGFLEGVSYIAYFLLLGSCASAVLILIVSHTSVGANSGNRFPLLIAFGVLSVYLSALRIWWHIIDMPVWALVLRSKRESAGVSTGDRP